MSNASKYYTRRLKIFFKGIIPSILALLSNRNNKLVILNSFLNVQFTDNTKFLFEYLISNEPSLTVKYVINDDRLREELINQYGDYFIETNSIRGIFYALKARTWILTALELPVSGIFLHFRRNVILLTHGVTSKQAGLAEKKVSFLKKLYYAIMRTNLSYVLTPCEDFKSIVASHFGVSPTKNMLVSGFPRFDPLLNQRYTAIPKDENEIAVLYAPTWRPYSDVILFPFKDFNEKELTKFCLEKNIKIYIRVHPHFENNIPSSILELPFVKLFSAHDYSDINDYLPNFDMLITDYSSIFYDFMILDRPIFFFMYDISEYENQIGLAVNFDKYAVGYKPNSQVEFLKDLNDALYNDSFASQRQAIKKITCGNSNNNSKDLIQLMRKMSIL